MARSSVRTMLPLDRFTRLVSYSPMLFNQVYVTTDELQPVTACSDPILQYTWQPKGGGRPGREEIAEAIAQAEERITQVLGFTPLPQWVVDDRVIPPRPAPGAWRTAISPWLFSVRTSNKYVIQGGVEAWSAISLARAVTYSDEDGDGYKETATVSVPTTVTDADEIEVFYPGESHDPAWEIRPIRVTLSGGTATIKFERHQAVMPDLLEALNAEGVDGTVDASFLTTVDVYRHYNDPSTMAVVEWQPSICDEAQCQVEADTGCFAQLNERNGIVAVHAATWDSDDSQWEHRCCSWWRPPTSVRLWYRAGYRNKNLARPMHDMDSKLERAIAYLALSFMDREWLACEQIRNLQAHWRTDLALRSSNPSQSTSFQTSRRVLDNPFGTTRACLYAWDVVQPMIVGEAVRD